jgi:hypothetical protein
VLESWKEWSNGVLVKWSDGKSQRKTGLAFPLTGIMEDEKE